MKSVLILFIFCILCFWASISMAAWVLIKVEHDLDNDGSIDEAMFAAYNSDGNLTKEEYDWDNDGSIDEVRVHTYDANGNRIKTEIDNDNDGLIDEVWFNTYDSNGNMIKDEYDYDNDGSIDDVWFNSYDSYGRLIKDERDYDNDGSIDLVRFHTYDANGNRIKTEIDNNNDGSIDSVQFLTYNSYGNVIKEEYDHDNDGSIDWVWFYTYDIYGNMILAEADNYNDGSIDEVWSRTYDFSENTVKTEVDIDNDGSIDEVWIHTYWEHTPQSRLQIAGEVIYEGAPLCAMVLANGQHMFTCGENLGGYSLEVPLDENGEITLYGFASGFSPFKIVLTAGRALDFDLKMTRASADSKEVNITIHSDPGTTNPNWVRISGTVAYDGTPLCAMVLANGQSMFSCRDDLGTFDLEVPLDGNGEITLFGFCSGFAPYKEVFVP